MVLTLTSSMKQEVGMDRSCLEVHKGSSFMVVCKINKHLGVDMGRSSMVLMDTMSCNKKLVHMDSMQKVESYQHSIRLLEDMDRSYLAQHMNSKL
jgi:hypothetical protein